MCVYFEKVASHSVATPGINGIRCMKQVAQEASVRSEPLRRGYVSPAGRVQRDNRLR